MSSPRKKAPSPLSPLSPLPPRSPLQPVSTHFTLEFSPPEPGEPSAALLLHPADLRALGGLPGDVLRVLHQRLPLFVGTAWPSRRVSAGAVRLPCSAAAAEASLASRGCSASASASGGLAASLEPVVAAAAAAAAAAPAAQAVATAAAVHVIRGAPADEGRRGGPSLPALRSLLLGLVLPLGGARLALPPAREGAPLQHVRLLPRLHAAAAAAAAALEDPSSAAGACAVVAYDTEFVEGAPPPLALQQGQHQPLQQPHPQPVLLGGLEAQLAQLERLARAALAPLPPPPPPPAEGAAPAPPPPGLRLLRPTRGALLSGPPGTGKTLLARALAARLGAPAALVTVNGPELLSDVVGETEARLVAAWARAAGGGGLLFLDEVDALCPARDASASDASGASGERAGAGEVEARVLAQLCALMDASSGSGSGSGGVFVLGATNRPSALDGALRRPGRFDVEVVIGVPTAGARREILWACLGAYTHCVPRAAADALSGARMHGFVGADVAAACREAAWGALRRALGARAAAAGAASPQQQQQLEALQQSLAGMSLQDSSGAGGAGAAPAPLALTDLCITPSDLAAGLARVQPSALRDTAVEVAATPWSSIAGSEGVKARLVEAIEWPLRYPALFAALGVAPTRGILLYGPPGCSKTMMARAMATAGAANFISVKGPELLSKYVGDSEKAVAGVFARARAAAPCVLFFDEFDSLGAAREGGGGGEGGGEGGGGGGSVGVRVVAQLLQEMDGSRGGAGSSSSEGGGGGGGVVVVAATNRPDLIDAALLRPGRMDYLLYVGLPDGAAREAIAAAHLAALPAALRGEGLCARAIAAATEGCSGAEVVGVLREAGSRVLAEALGGEAGEAGEAGAAGAAGAAAPALAMRHVLAAVQGSSKQVTPEMLAWYRAWEASRGRG